MATQITTGASLLTLINVFQTTPDTQGRIVELKEQSTGEVVSKLPGFVSNNILKSTDGLRVVNYAQWESKEHFEAMMANAGPRHRRGEIEGLCTADPDVHFYEVVFTCHR
jgi:heme-degrading monooxygenase HmoA